MFQEKAMHYKEKKRSKTLVFLLTVDVCICVCILLAAWAIFLKEPQAVALAPDVAPSEVEPNQTPLIEEVASSESGDSGEDGTDGDTVEEPEDKRRVSLNYSDEVQISLLGKNVALYFGSGERSLVDIVVQVVVQDQVIAQSGKVTPGNKIESLDLLEDVAEWLSEGSCEGSFMLYYYDYDTGERLTIVNKIPITVVVHN